MIGIMFTHCQDIVSPLKQIFLELDGLELDKVTSPLASSLSSFSPFLINKKKHSQI
jgi:hypothetical protein